MDDVLAGLFGTERIAMALTRKKLNYLCVNVTFSDHARFPIFRFTTWLAEKDADFLRTG